MVSWTEGKQKMEIHIYPKERKEIGHGKYEVKYKLFLSLKIYLKANIYL